MPVSCHFRDCKALLRLCCISSVISTTWTVIYVYHSLSFIAGDWEVAAAVEASFSRWTAAFSQRSDVSGWFGCVQWRTTDWTHWQVHSATGRPAETGKYWPISRFVKRQRPEYLVEWGWLFPLLFCFFPLFSFPIYALPISRFPSPCLVLSHSFFL